MGDHTLYANGGPNVILEVVHHEKGVVEYRICPPPTEMSVFTRSGNSGLWPSMEDALAEPPAAP
jgi:hypothetical protein